MVRGRAPAASSASTIELPLRPVEPTTRIRVVFSARAIFGSVATVVAAAGAVEVAGAAPSAARTGAASQAGVASTRTASATWPAPRRARRESLEDIVDSCGKDEGKPEDGRS